MGAVIHVLYRMEFEAPSIDVKPQNSRPIGIRIAQTTVSRTVLGNLHRICRLAERRLGSLQGSTPFRFCPRIIRSITKTNHPYHLATKSNVPHTDRNDRVQTNRVWTGPLSQQSLSVQKTIVRKIRGGQIKSVRQGTEMGHKPHPVPTNVNRQPYRDQDTKQRATPQGHQRQRIGLENAIWRPPRPQINGL